MANIFVAQQSVDPKPQEKLLLPTRFALATVFLKVTHSE